MSISPENGELYQGVHSVAFERLRHHARRLGVVALCGVTAIATTNIVQSEVPEKDVAAAGLFEPVLLSEQTISSDGFIEHEVQQFEVMREAAQNQDDPTPEVEILREEPLIDEMASIIEEAAVVHEIDPNMMAAFLWKESCGNPDPGISSAGARGIMQVMPATAADMIERYDVVSYDPQDPHDSIMMAARVIQTNRDHYLPNMIDSKYLENSETATEIIPVSYNWGIGGAQRYVESGFDRTILPTETQDYLVEVEYLLEEMPSNGQNTRCHGNPQAQ